MPPVPREMPGARPGRIVRRDCESRRQGFRSSEESVDTSSDQPSVLNEAKPPPEYAPVILHPVPHDLGPVSNHAEVAVDALHEAVPGVAQVAHHGERLDGSAVVQRVRAGCAVGMRALS